MTKAMFNRKEFPLFALLIPFVSSCMKYKFHKFDDVFYNGAVLVTYRRELRAYDCKRACLMTKGCRGFNMEWIQDKADVGYCGLVDMRLAKTLTFKSNYSVYGKHCILRTTGCNNENYVEVIPLFYIWHDCLEMVSYRFLALCPSGMIFYPTTSRCYEVISKRKNWSESQQYCRSLYDQAHLMEIYDSKQEELFENMTKGN